MGQRVLITGGSGFIGSALVGLLMAEPSIDEIVVFDGRERESLTLRDSSLSDPIPAAAASFADSAHGASATGASATGASATGASASGMGRVTVITGNVLNRAELTAACRGIDVVVHLAAQVSASHAELDPLLTHEVNVTGTLILLDVVAAQTPPPLVIFASSAAVYGGGTLDSGDAADRAACQPQGVYGASKAAAENYISAFQASRGIPVLVLRLYNVFGPGQRCRTDLKPVVPMAIAAALSGEALPVMGDGEQIRDFTFVGDVAAVLASAVVNRISAPRPLDISWEAGRTVNELIAVVEQASGARIARVDLPPRPEDIRVSQGTRADLKRYFPTVQPSDFAESIATTIQWSAALAGLSPVRVSG